jgi:hypothetical protein
LVVIEFAETASIIRRTGRDQNKGAEPMGRHLPEDAVKDEVTYFFLIKDTGGTALTAAQRKKAIGDVTKLVKQEGGQCQLFSTRGAPSDYVSVITGITTAAAIRIAAEIEKQGTEKATLISGIEVFFP